MPPMIDGVEPWSVEILDEKQFDRFVKKLGPYEEVVLFAAIDHILKPLGIDICNGEWGKALGDGLYEFRVRRSLAAIYSAAGLDEDDLPSDVKTPNKEVLLRVFCTFHGAKVMLILSGYDKKKDPSEKRQQREIKKARRLLKKWREQQKRA